MTSAARPWQILSGFFVSGLMLALPGALLPLWDFHIKPDFALAGNFFLAMGAGSIFGGALGLRLDLNFSARQVLSAGCFLAAFSFLALCLGVPPAPSWFQGACLFAAGVSAGLINTAILEAIAPWYELNPAGTTLLAGSFFGAGCSVAALVLAAALNSFYPVRWLFSAAAIPAALGAVFSRLSLPPGGGPTSAATRPRGRALEELRSPLAVLFALLLFFQFGSEWALAGWLPVYLTGRLGSSPSTGVLLLAFYWFALTFGRLLLSRLLPRFSHWRMLAASAFCALFGCTVLFAAKNLFGVVSGLLLTGAGFSAIYPLSAERIGQRFSSYHPAYYNGIFSFALVGATVAPWALGHLAAGSSLEIVPLAAMLSSCAVFALILLIWLGSKVSGG